MLADTKPVQIQRQWIDASKIEKCPASHIMSSFFYMIGLFFSPHNKHKGKVTWFDSDSSHLWGGVLCDDTIKKQLCSRLMFGWNTYFKQEKQAFPFSPTLKSVVQLLKLTVGNNKQAHNQGSQWFCGWMKERVYIVLFSEQYTTWCQCVNNFVADSSYKSQLCKHTNKLLTKWLTW